MFDLNIDWMWVSVGFIVGVGCSWFVSDLVFTTVNVKEEDHSE
jgi:hypothetical protein